MQTLHSTNLTTALLLSLLGTAAGIAGTSTLALRGAYPDAAGDLIEELKIVGDYAYLANGRAGLRIVNISDPKNPFLVGSYVYPEGRKG